jgi:serine/threonine protein phosphatase PrpC
MIQTSSYSEAGGHAVNEDAFRVMPHPWNPECWLVALADGQRGRAGGRRASQLACDTVIDAASAADAQSLLNPLVWVSLLRAADLEMAADPEAGFTTLIGLCLFGDDIAGASNGDSSVLARLGSGVTTDLTASQLKNPPIGSGVAAVRSFASRLSKPYCVLAMTDGVWKYAGRSRIIDFMQNERGEALLECLQRAARLPGSGKFQDDFTAVMLECC